MTTTARVHAGAILPLRAVGGFGRQAADGLVRWAQKSGARLTILDCDEGSRHLHQEVLRIASTADLFFGPYGSGLTRAVADALAGTPWVIWNHGGAEAPDRRARVIDVLGPARTYWDGLGDVLLADGVPIDRVVLARGESPFAISVCQGAIAALERAGAAPLEVVTLRERSAAQVVARAGELGAAAVVGCGRPSEDLALGRALVGSAYWIGLVVCGVQAAKQVLGESIIGWVGPAQWLATRPGPIPTSADYPAAQAYAAATLARRALDLAGTSEPDAIWDAARAMQTDSLLGPFAVDGSGRQIAHRPLLVRWEGRPCERRVAWRPSKGHPFTVRDLPA